MIATGEVSKIVSIFRHVIEGQQPNVAQAGAGDQQHSYGITIPLPVIGDDFSLGFTNKNITVQEIRAVLRGSNSPSITWTIRFDNTPDRSAPGTEVINGGISTTSITSGDDITTFDNPGIPADSFVWVEVTGKSGSVEELHITIIF